MLHLFKHFIFPTLLLSYCPLIQYLLLYHQLIFCPQHKINRRSDLFFIDLVFIAAPWFPDQACSEGLLKISSIDLTDLKNVIYSISGWSSEQKMY